MTLKTELQAALLARLRIFDGEPWSADLQSEVRRVTLVFLAEHGLYPKKLGIGLSDDGFIEIDADNYVSVKGVN